MGVIVSNGVIVINDDVVRGLGIVPETIRRVSDEEGY
jgi:predicted phosphoribosyltransferase